MSVITISFIQSNLIWEDKQANINRFTSLINNIPIRPDIIILPETFPTGFSMNNKELAETMNGNIINWMKSIARKKNTAICGSLIVSESGKYYNRFVFATSDDKIYYYNKRHLFQFGESKNFTSGDSKVIIEYKGWKLCPMICYDLRFPVWSRNCENYDILIYAANWPSERREVWLSLLKARAIENLCYVTGVNRIGTDKNNIVYSGDSSVYSPAGNLISFIDTDKEETQTVQLSKDELMQYRKQFAFLNDADRFEIT